MSVIEEIAAERKRQIEVEGFTTADDDRHNEGEMGAAAACYAAPFRVFRADEMSGRSYETFTAYRDGWPWHDEWWKPKGRRSDLIRAAALIVAEIERLDRLDREREGE